VRHAGGGPAIANRFESDVLHFIWLFRRLYTNGIGDEVETMFSFTNARFLANAELPRGTPRGWVAFPVAWTVFSVGCGTPIAPSAPSVSSLSVQLTGSQEGETRVNVHDAGEVLAGNTIRHTFEVHNSLPESVEIKGEADVQANCGCSSLVPQARRLEPGQTTGVTITIHTARRQGPLLQGGTSAQSGKQCACANLQITVDSCQLTGMTRTCAGGTGCQVNYSDPKKGGGVKIPNQFNCNPAYACAAGQPASPCPTN
jgi:hypothetical protein